MTLNDLLQSKNILPDNVLVLRHRPHEPQLRKVLPWLAAERSDLFDAYQQTQSPRVEIAIERLNGKGFVASFVGLHPGKAWFVGLYAITASKSITNRQFWKTPAYVELKKLGMRGWVRKESSRSTILRFDLKLQDFYSHWKGKLVISWPSPELAWWRRGDRNAFSVLSVLEESAFDAEMPAWDELDLSWEQLAVLPTRWRAALHEWRGVYYIFDTSDGKAYVGSAYGQSNILGRWESYATRGHGSNRLLRKRDPRNFRFTILQRLSPDLDATSVIRSESTWKERLHTRQPFGLNEN